MTLTVAILVASVLSFGLKLLGHLVPLSWLSHPIIARTANLLTVGLLAALVASEGLTSGRHVVVDARVAALAVAAVLYWRKAPFVVVVIAAAAVAAGLRAFGIG